jgi:hypothetical protein
MATETEVNAVVIFDDAHTLQVSSTPEEIKNQLGGSTTPHLPLLELRDPRGESVWVNANQIRAFHAYSKGGAKIVGF